MPKIYLDFGPTWQLSATGGWTVRVQGDGNLVMAREEPKRGSAVARILVPVYNAPMLTLLRFCLESGPGDSGGNIASVKVNTAVVWRKEIRAGGAAEAPEYHEATLTDPLGGDITIEFRVDDSDASTGCPPACVVWSRPHLELLGWGEHPPPWGLANRPR